MHPLPLLVRLVAFNQINRQQFFDIVFSWLTGGRARRQDTILANANNANNGTNTPYTPDSTQLLNNSNPSSINHIDPESADLNL